MTTILLIATAILLAVDWLQTVTIARNPARWYERNGLIVWAMRAATDRLFLPEAGVHVYFAASAAFVGAGAAVIFALWPDHLIGWAVLWVVWEGYFTYQNHRLGIRPARP